MKEAKADNKSFRMKESVGSLRFYFGIVGLFYLLSSLKVFTSFTQGFSSAPVIWFLAILGFCWGIGYLYFAITLPKHLSLQSGKYVNFFLITFLIDSVLTGLISLIFAGEFPVISIVIEVFVTWYLISSVKRLSLSQQTKES